MKTQVKGKDNKRTRFRKAEDGEWFWIWIFEDSNWQRETLVTSEIEIIPKVNRQRKKNR